MADSPRLAVFDCDGTLVDSQRAITACMGQAFQEEGLLAPPLAAVRQVIGLPLHVCMARLAPSLAEPRLERLVMAYQSAFFAMRQRPDIDEPLFEGVAALLEALDRDGVLLGIATGKRRRGLDAVLAHHGLSRRFATLQTSDTGPGKPHPAMLERAMAEAGVGPRDTVMIGDTSFDMIMARGAGAFAVGVEWGYHEVDELRQAGAQAIAGRCEDLPALLCDYWERRPCV